MRLRTFLTLSAMFCFSGDAALAQSSSVSRSVLIVRGTMDAPVMRPILNDFAKQHPQIPVEYEERSSLELFAGFSLAAKEGTATADLIMSSAIDLQMKLVNDGHAASHGSVHQSSLPEWAVWRDEAFAFSFEPVVTVFNANLLSGSEKPSNRYHLLQTLRANPLRFTGRIGSYDPVRSGTGYLYLTQDIEQSPIIWELIQALGATNLRLYATSRNMIDAVLSGGLLVGYNVVGSYALARAREEPALGVIMPEDYTLMVPRTAFISRHGKSPARAATFLDYLLSERGQRVLAQTAKLFPVRNDVRGPEIPKLSDYTEGGTRTVRMSPGLLVYVDRLKREKVLRRWETAIKVTERKP